MGSERLQIACRKPPAHHDAGRSPFSVPFGGEIGAVIGINVILQLGDAGIGLPVRLVPGLRIPYFTGQYAAEENLCIIQWTGAQQAPGPGLCEKDGLPGVYGGIIGVLVAEPYIITELTVG